MARQAFSMVPLPTNRSTGKPRQRGLTMMMDWGLPLGIQREWLGLLAPHVDLAKLVTGNSRLYEEDYLREKLALYNEHQVTPFIGGQFLEYVFATLGMQGVEPFCREAVRLGIGAIEVSDNVVSLTDDERTRLIKTALDCGLHVHGEVGSKHEDSGAETLVAQANACFAAGADVVLVEGAELLHKGVVNTTLIDGLSAALDLDRVIFELSGPWIPNTTLSEICELQYFLIDRFGPDVNIANVMPDAVWALEAQRCGLGVTGPPKSSGQD